MFFPKQQKLENIDNQKTLQYKKFESSLEREKIMKPHVNFNIYTEECQNSNT